MYCKQLIIYLLLTLVGIPIYAQMENGYYQGFKIVKGQDQTDIIFINVLSLGNSVSQFSDGQTKKPLQGTYHIIVSKYEYNIGNFSKGIANGDWEEYNSNTLIGKCTFKNGKYDGNVYIYGFNGSGNRYQNVSTYKDGVKQHAIMYHPNGQVEEELYYDENGLQQGEVIVYNEKGNIIQQLHYLHGNKHGTQMKISDSGGKETSEYVNGRLTGEFCELYPNGSVHRKGMYDENGKRTGKWTFGKEDGDLDYELDFLNDNWNGELRNYYKGNVLASIKGYTNGSQNGKLIEYNENPHVISCEETYVNGRKNGPFKTYQNGTLWKEGIARNGKVVYEKEYENGKLQTVRLLDETGSLVDVEHYNKAGQETYKNTNYKKHPSLKLKESASGVIDVEVE